MCDRQFFICSTARSGLQPFLCEKTIFFEISPQNSPNSYSLASNNNRPVLHYAFDQLYNAHTPCQVNCLGFRRSSSRLFVMILVENDLWTPLHFVVYFGMVTRICRSLLAEGIRRRVLSISVIAMGKMVFLNSFKMFVLLCSNYPNICLHLELLVSILKNFSFTRVTVNSRIVKEKSFIHHEKFPLEFCRQIFVKLTLLHHN